MADRRNNGSPKKPLGTQLFRRTELKFERPVFSAMRENQSCYLLNPHFLSARIYFTDQVVSNRLEETSNQST